MHHRDQQWQRIAFIHFSYVVSLYTINKKQKISNRYDHLIRDFSFQSAQYFNLYEFKWEHNTYSSKYEYPWKLTCSYRYSDKIVDRGSEEIQADPGYSLPGQLDGSGHIQQVILLQKQVMINICNMLQYFPTILLISDPLNKTEMIIIRSGNILWVYSWNKVSSIEQNLILNPLSHWYPKFVYTIHHQQVTIIIWNKLIQQPGYRYRDRSFWYVRNITTVCCFIGSDHWVGCDKALSLEDCRF